MAESPIYRCPKCDSERVATYSEQAFMVNTGEFFCESVKPHDSDSKATCYDCWWEGKRQDLLTGAPHE